MRRVALAAAALVVAVSLTACGNIKPLTCPEGQHVEDHGHYALITHPMYVGKIMTVVTSPVWQSNPVCVKND